MNTDYDNDYIDIEYINEQAQIELEREHNILEIWDMEYFND